MSYRYMVRLWNNGESVALGFSDLRVAMTYIGEVHEFLDRVNLLYVREDYFPRLTEV